MTPPLVLGILASSKFTAATSYESIATVTVGSGGAANVEFTSIPSTYTHLQIRCITRASTGGVNNFNMQFNDDTGNNYATHDLYGNGTSAAAQASSSRADIWTVWAGSTASTFGGTVFDILDYANTNKYKTVRSLSGYDANGSGEIHLTSGLWRSSNAITKIKLGLTTPVDFTQYSHFALYGCKI